MQAYRYYQYRIPVEATNFHYFYLYEIAIKIFIAHIYAIYSSGQGNMKHAEYIYAYAHYIIYKDLAKLDSRRKNRHEELHQH